MRISDWSSHVCSSDLVIITGQPKSIEVKTRQFVKRPTEITRWPVDIKAKGDADFFIFVEMDLRTLSPTFYLLTNAQARETHKDYIGGGNCAPPPVRKLVNANDSIGRQHVCTTVTNEHLISR